MDRTVSSSINHFPLKCAARGCCVLWCVSIHFPGNPSAAVIFQAEADRARKKTVPFPQAHSQWKCQWHIHWCTCPIEAPSGKERCNANLTNPATSVFELVPLPEVASCLVWFEVMSSGLVSRQTDACISPKTKKAPLTKYWHSMRSCVRTDILGCPAEFRLWGMLCAVNNHTENLEQPVFTFNSCSYTEPLLCSSNYMITERE